MDAPILREVYTGVDRSASNNKPNDAENLANDEVNCGESDVTQC
jgi:hypothetical protein